MATDAQEKEIKRLMARIKEAKDDGKNSDVIESRTRDLVNYLIAQGLYNPNE